MPPLPQTDAAMSHVSQETDNMGSWAARTGLLGSELFILTQKRGWCNVHLLLSLCFQKQESLFLGNEDSVTTYE